MKLVGYIRVSSDSQEENTSLGEQEKKIRAYCDAFDHELVHVFREVKSAKNIQERPQFQAALDMVRNEADGIIAAKLDRLARNTKDVLILVDDILIPLKKALMLVDLKVDTTDPMGYAILSIMAVIAKLERDVINERTQGGRRVKNAQGGYAYGSPAYGQKSVNKELAPFDEELEVVEIIRKHRKSGKSYQKIADFLNEKGIKTKRGFQWETMQVMRVLKRLKYEAKSVD